MASEEQEIEQFDQAFGEHTSIPEDCREWILSIKNNDPSTCELAMIQTDVECFTDLSWRLFGRYIANNTQLEDLDFSNCGITDEKMALLFSELTGSVSLDRLDLDHNEFGIEGVRNMFPFFEH